MKKIIFIMLSLGLFLVNANAAILGVFSFAAKTKEGTKAGQWDYLYASSNVTYNPQSGYWVTKATHWGEGYLATVVLADSFNDITKIPIVGTSSGDAIFRKSEDTYMSGKPARIFYFMSKADTNGLFKSFYSYKNTVLSSMDRFLQNR